MSMPVALGWGPSGSPMLKTHPAQAWPFPTGSRSPRACKGRSPSLHLWRRPQSREASRWRTVPRFLPPMWERFEARGLLVLPRCRASRAGRPRHRHRTGRPSAWRRRGLPFAPIRQRHWQQLPPRQHPQRRRSKCRNLMLAACTSHLQWLLRVRPRLLAQGAKPSTRRWCAHLPGLQAVRASRQARQVRRR